MARYVKNVSIGLNKKKFLIGDMPFLSYRKGLEGCHGLRRSPYASRRQRRKTEGLKGHEEIVEHIVGSGTFVMGHLGLTPQSVHGLGGYRVQGRTDKVAAQLIEDALKLQELGAFALVSSWCLHSWPKKSTLFQFLRSVSVQAPHVTGKCLSCMIY